MSLRLVFSLVSLYLLSACASHPVGVVYTNVTNARSYRAATPDEVTVSNADPAATGKSCSQGVLGLVAWGDGGYGAAVDSALEKQTNERVLYDVKADVESMNILGFIYQKYCTRVIGKVGSLPVN